MLTDKGQRRHGDRKGHGENGRHGGGQGAFCSTRMTSGGSMADIQIEQDGAIGNMRPVALVDINQSQKIHGYRMVAGMASGM